MNTNIKNKERVSMDERIENFENAYLYEKDYGNELLDLAKAITASVLHTVRDPQRKTGKDTVYIIGVNTEKLNGYYNIAFDAMLSQLNASPDYNDTFSDSCDLVQTAALAILEEASKHLSRFGDMQKAYTEKKVSRKVVIDAPPIMEEQEVAPIQKVYRAVRKAIDAEKSVKFDPANGYLYFSDLLSVDDENGESAEIEIYKRAPKFYDLGSYEIDFNGAEKAYTPDGDGKDELQTIESMIAKMKLSEMQAAIVHYRLQGYGKKAISRKLNIKEDCYKVHMKRIKAKAEKTFPEYVNK